MVDLQTFERRVADEMVRRAGPSLPVDDLAIYEAVRRTTGPRSWPLPSLFSAAKFVVAGAIVALFGGFLLAGVLTQPSEESLPAVGASASPTAQVEPTPEARREPESAPTDADAERADSTPKVDLAGVFSPTGSMEKARAGHTATHLLDGRVLIVGGFGSEDSQGSAETWDPETGSFSAAGSLVQPRYHDGGHTATLLPDGRVLIVGGLDQDGQGLTSAEIWDSDTATFSPAGTLAEGHAEHTATLLPDGRVLIVGGYRRFQEFAQTAEVWDAETETFAPADLLAATRFGHTATLLPDGRVLIIGGEGESAGGAAVIADPPAEVWDSVSGEADLAGSLAEPRFNHTATLLADDRVLVIGGYWHGAAGIYAPTSVAEVWDPETASFDPAGTPLVQARRGHTATLLPDGRVLIVGGDSGYNERYAVHAEAEIWEPDTASFSPAGSLAEARAYHTATLLRDGRILVVGGGVDGGPWFASAEIWEPADRHTAAYEAVAAASGPTAYPPIELPAEIPAGMEAGTLETPLGPARWVHLSGDEESIPPELSGLLSTPDGYVVPEWGAPWWGGGKAKLWRSSDLIGWTSEPLGAEARYGELSWAGDAYWLNVHEPSSLWRSPDTKSWEQVSFEGLAPPGPEGFAWTLRPGRPLAYGGVTIVPFEWVTDSWVVVRGLPGADDVQEATLVETAPGVFDIEDWVVGADSRGTFATVRFEETDDGLRVLDHEDGTELKALEGVSMEFIKLLAFDVESEFDEIAWQPLPRLAILDGTTLIEVEPPLEGDPYRQAYTVDGEGFVSITIGPDGLAHMHRSEDGREWREIEVIGDDVGEPTDFGEVWADRGSVWMGASAVFWRLTDGLVWESVPEDGLPIGTGRLLGPITMAGNPVFHPDEGVPVEIDIAEAAFNVRDCGGGGDTLLGPNTMASYVIDERCAGGEREVLIITFDDVPA